MKTKIQLFFHVVLLGTLCVPNFAQNGELDTQSADQMTRYLESLRSNKASARSRALTERTSKRARFARIGSAFLQVAREGLAKQPISAWQGISSTGGDAIPVAPPEMAQAPMARPFALSNIAQPVRALAAPHRLVLSPSAQQSAKRVLSALRSLPNSFGGNLYKLSNRDGPRHISHTRIQSRSGTCRRNVECYRPFCKHSQHSTSRRL
jgi:hypothetical protein